MHYLEKNKKKRKNYKNNQKTDNKNKRENPTTNITFLTPNSCNIQFKRANQNVWSKYIFTLQHLLCNNKNVPTGHM